ncbi:MAG: cytochrome c oxidase subunit II [Caldilineaceae bacterium]
MRRWIGKAFCWSAILVSLLGASACSRAPAVLDPHGPAAVQISGLSWLLIGLGTLVYVGVSGFLLAALFRRRQAQRAVGVSRENGGPPIVIWGGIVMPVVVLLIVFGLTLNTLIALSAPEHPDELVINVIGHQWWWEVEYPAQEILTANEIHIPVGQPVRIRLMAEDVIHSFWVPQLHGKLDMIPGQTNTFRIQADTPGAYRGLCAEFCGIQHARMLFLVVAKAPADFVAWVETQRAPAAAPTTTLAEQGQALFLDSTCAQCHAIAGTTAAGQLGPDLTHFASRSEIAAGVLENNRTNLATWITDPQKIKRGSLMPATLLTVTELEALLAYLESLK